MRAIRRRGRRSACIGAALAGLLLLCIQTIVPAQQTEGAFARVLTLDGVVGPASADYLVRGIEDAAADGASAIVLRIDTPGGLDTSMRRIIRAIVASPVPVLSWVGPGGARAASAGTYIVMASHVASMAPGTNIGAATPVAIAGGLPKRPAPDDDGRPGRTPAGDADGQTPEPPPGEDRRAPLSTSERKAVNDAVAYLRSLAEMRGRNADWAESAVRDSASLAAGAALRAGVVDFIARDAENALEQADGKRVRVQGGERVLDTAGLRADAREPDWRTRILAIIANPNVALILMMIGVYGLFFEFVSPGSFVPGTLGAISLIVGLYALAMLPLDFAGVALIVLGLALLITEAFVPSFGILGIGGVAALVIGAAIFVDVDGIPGYEVALPMVAAFGIVGLALALITARLAVGAFRRPVRAGEGALVGRTGEVLDWQRGAGHVHVEGERWYAEKMAGTPQLQPGERVSVDAVRGLTLVVSPIRAGEPAGPVPEPKEPPP